MPCSGTSTQIPDITDQLVNGSDHAHKTATGIDQAKDLTSAPATVRRSKESPNRELFFFFLFYPLPCEVQILLWRIDIQNSTSFSTEPPP
jgi:hypothetical protein